MKTLNKLMHKVDFLENMAVKEIDGENWQKKLEAFAEIKPVYDSGVGQIAALSFGHVITEEYYLFKTRYNKEVNNKMRIIFQNKIFEIKRIINEQSRNKMLKIITLQIS